jgi:hypothetical protein
LEVARRNVEAVNRGDLDAAFRNWAQNAVWDDSALGLGTHEGLAAIRQHVEEWRRAYEEFGIAIEERHDLGNGLTFSVSLQKGRPVVTLVRGSEAQIAALRTEDEFERLIARAALVVQNVGVVDAAVGDGVQDAVAVYQAAVSDLT